MKRGPFAVELSQVLLGFPGRVRVHGRSAYGSTVQVISPEFRSLFYRSPAVADGFAVVLKVNRPLSTRLAPRSCSLRSSGGTVRNPVWNIPCGVK